jgi:Uma2 family endonuclease
MKTIEAIHLALRSLTLEQRERVASWLEGYQDEEVNAPIGVAEPSAVRAVEPPPFMTEDEYLEFERNSPMRHEYVNGVVYAMSGASLAHNRLIARLHIALQRRLRGGPCEVFIQDLKLKLARGSDSVFYYPDLMVSCDHIGWYQEWVLNPRLVIEVVSSATKHIDRREKAMIYRKIDTIEEYAIVTQHSTQVTIHRRVDNWVPHVVSDPDATVEFRSVAAAVPLAEIYENIFA